MKRFLKPALFAAALTLGFIALGSGESQAKSQLVNLKNKKVYSAYDVTCDGKADKVQVKSKTKKKSGKNTMKIVVNGKVAFKHNEFEGVPHVSLMLMENNQTLISVYHQGMNDYGLRSIYSYCGTNWRKVMSLNASKEAAKYDYAEGSVSAVSGNAVTINFFGQSAMVGVCNYDMVFEYADGKLDLSTPIVDLYITKLQKKMKSTKDETMVARIDMDVYDQAGEGGTVAFPIKAGDSVQFQKIQRINDRPWYYVVVGENKGWLPCGVFKYYTPPDGQDYDEYEGASGYFRGAMYAG